MTLSGSETTFPAPAGDARRADVRITALEAIPFAVPYRRPAGFASGTVTTRGQRARPRPHRRRPRRAGRGAAAPVHLRRDAGLDRPHRPARRSRTCSSASTRSTPSWSHERCAPDHGQLRRPRRRRPRGLGPRRQGPRPPVPHAARRLRRRRRGRAHGLVRRARRRWPRTPSTSTTGSACGRSRSRSGARRTLDVAATRAIREALPDADLYVDANRGWSYDDALRAGDALLELGVRAIEEPISVDDRAGRLRLAERWPVPLVGDESCISLAHVDRALEEGAVRRGERQDGADRVHRVAPDPRPVPRPQHARSSSAASTRARSGRWRRSRSPPRSPRRPAAGRDHELPRPRRRPRRRPARDPRRPRGGAGRGRASASRSTRSACSATGWTADAVHGRDGGPPPARHAGRAGRRAQGARARVLAGAPARRPLAAPVAGRRPLRERERPRRRLRRRAARAPLRPSAVPLPRHPRHAAGAPPQRHRPEERSPCPTAPTS